MNKLTAVSTIILLVAIFGATSCQPNSSEKMKDAKSELVEADKNLEKAKEEYLAEVNKFKKETYIKISANEQSIKEFKVRIVNSKGEAKADYDKKINDLEQKNTEMQRKLDEYKLEGNGKWRAFKEEFSHDMNELGKALKDLTSNNVE